MILTNDETVRIDENTIELRKYELLAEDGDEVWVKVVNGFYKGERLTFKKKHMRELNETDPQ